MRRNRLWCAGSGVRLHLGQALERTSDP